MRVLVVPASKHGGTAEIGRTVATRLRAKGLDVDVSQPEHMFDLTPYDAFVIGSGLYMGKWLDKASRFVDDYHHMVRNRPTWLFSSGPLGPDKPEDPIRPEIVERLLSDTQAREHRLFGGRLNLGQLGQTERFIAKWVGARDGDYREWDAIETWADAIAADLVPAGPRVIDGIGRATRPAGIQ